MRREGDTRSCWKIGKTFPARERHGLYGILVAAARSHVRNTTQVGDNRKATAIRVKKVRRRGIGLRKIIINGRRRLVTKPRKNTDSAVTVSGPSVQLPPVVVPENVERLNGPAAIIQTDHIVTYRSKNRGRKYESGVRMAAETRSRWPSTTTDVPVFPGNRVRIRNTATASSPIPNLRRARLIRAVFSVRYAHAAVPTVRWANFFLPSETVA